ncbi:MAG: prepilin-type N-terminal cleavage/methylation domain-containing protein [Parcubacteria group bacterium]
MSKVKITTTKLKVPNTERGLTPFQTDEKVTRDNFQGNNVKNLKFVTGFTLVELMIALGIFSVIMTISAAILLNSLKTARFVASQARAMDNISLAMEQIVREVRTGSKIEVNRTKDLVKEFSFTNYEGEDVTYSFCDSRICRNNRPITEEGTIITGGFYVDTFSGTDLPKTPRITVVAQARDAKDNALGSLQTTVSARLLYYKQQL